MTGGCCESHYKNDICGNMHIVFYKNYGFGETIPLPDGFKYDKKYTAIIFNYKNKTSEDEMMAIKEKKLSELLAWCNNLPSIRFSRSREEGE